MRGKNNSETALFVSRKSAFGARGLLGRKKETSGVIDGIARDGLAPRASAVGSHSRSGTFRGTSVEIQTMPIILER